jgi:hypothetical protein
LQKDRGEELRRGAEKIAKPRNCQIFPLVDLKGRLMLVFSEMYIAYE